jgi:hypothetical protein
MVTSLIGQMWKPSGDLVRIKDGAAFLTFSRPGYAKAATNLRVEEHERGTRLSTETRVLATNHAGRPRFALYWMLIRGGVA